MSTEPVIQQTSMEYAIVDSSLGRLLLARTERGLCAVLFGDDDGALITDLRTRFPSVALTRADDALLPVSDAVLAVVESSDGDIRPDVPLDLHGTPFQRLVWEALLCVPAGTTTTYSEIAERIGRPSSVRAVAQACGANALAVIVPCHRAVRRDGGVSGYRWGVDRKRRLLEREGAVQSLKL
jgi:AraC family transcriptional regulator of adaptative response/methylated-DNA-[protein]-cysteine methyltransferase